MSVLLSMLTLVPGDMGGSETYARELVHELAGRDLDVSTLVAPAARGFSDVLREQVANEYPGGATRRERASAQLFAAARRKALRRHLRGADVVHFPFTVPTPAVQPGQRLVVTLHDVQHHDLPAMFSRPERIYRSVAYDRAARRADAVLTVSRFAKERIVRHLGIEPERVHVAHLGVRQPPSVPGRAKAQPGYLLYPARGWAHKNHQVLFDAMPSLRRRIPNLRLVLTGAGAAELPPLPAGAEARGHVPRAELHSLYQQAAALVFPSLYEGFGLPVLEAMAHGCPVAAARAGALPEVVGDAGVLFDPRNPESIVDGVLQTLDRVDELRARGLLHAQQWSWAACADAHVAVYKHLGG